MLVDVWGCKQLVAYTILAGTRSNQTEVHKAVVRVSAALSMLANTSRAKYGTCTIARPHTEGGELSCACGQSFHC